MDPGGYGEDNNMATKKKAKPAKKKAAAARKPAPKKAAKTKPVKKKAAPARSAKPKAKAKPAAKKAKPVVKKAKPAAKKPVKAAKPVAKKNAKAPAKAAAKAKKPVVKKVSGKKTAASSGKTSGSHPFPVKDLPKSIDELLGRPTAKSLARKATAQKALTAKEIGKFKESLLNLRDRIIDEISFLSNDNLNKSSKEASGDLSSYSLHMADQGTDNFDREFAASLLNTEHDVLYEIDEALRRIEQGTYGICEISGQPVERERLKVLPFARYCVAVQSEIERKNPRQKPFRTKNGMQSADFSAGS